MNKQSFRLVFNRRRAMAVAVEETATSAGRSASGETRASVRSRAPEAAMAAVAAITLPGVLLPSVVLAQIVPSLGASTQVVPTQNGLPQVNIAAPSGAGVSINTYSQFDVHAPGAILNNSPAIIQTQQAGMINGNPNFAPDQSARIIVNQVNSNNPSQLRGFVEVGGSRAEVVLANPAGIMVDGGGFINTSRATLTTGQPFYGQDGTLAGYHVSRGLITVHGAGLNASSVDQIDLISRAVQANAAIHAKTLNVVTGANQIDRETLATQATAGDGPAPGISIDVGQLGGMYANRIFLVGTEHGVGVHHAGVLAAEAGDLTLQSNGQLVLSGETRAAGQLVINAREDIVHSGTTYGQQGVQMSTLGTLTHSGVLQAGQNLAVKAGRVDSSGTLAAGVNQDGSIGEGGDLNVAASGNLKAVGENAAGGNASLTGGSVDISGSHTQAKGSLALTAQAGDVQLTGAQTGARGEVQVNAAGALINDRGTLSGQAGMRAKASRVSNQDGEISARESLTIETGGQFANQRGKLLTGGAFKLTAGEIANHQGTIESGGKLSVSGASLENTAGRIVSLNGGELSVQTVGQITNVSGTTATGAQGGVIRGNGEVKVKGGRIVNRGAITTDANLSVTGESIANDGGTLKAARNVMVEAGAHLTNAGATIEGERAELSGAILDNSSGNVLANQVALDGADLINRGGTIKQTGAGSMRIDISGKLDNSNGGSIETQSTDLAFEPAMLVNDGGTIEHAGVGTLTLGPNSGFGSISNVGGKMVSNGQVLARGIALDNTNGAISGKTGLTATVADTLDNAGGKLLSDGDLRLYGGGTLKNASGQIETAANATIQVKALRNSGRIIAGQAAKIEAASLENSDGTIQGAQVDLTAENLTNHRGTIKQSGTAAMTVKVGGKLDNSNDGLIATNSADLALTPATLTNDGGRIEHVGAGVLTLGSDAGLISNVAGNIISNGEVVARSGKFDNTDGTVSGKTGLTAAVTDTLDNTRGKLLSQGAMRLDNGGTLKNAGGLIETARDATIQVQTLTNSGQIIAGQAANVVAASFDNTDGTVSGKTDLTATVTGTLDNARGKLLSDGHLQLDGGGTLKNLGGEIATATDMSIQAAALLNGGRVIAERAMKIEATSLDNSDGTIQGAQVGLAAETLINRRGLIKQTGIDAMTVKVSGSLDNSQGGVIETKSTDLTLAPVTFINDGGTLTHAGAGALRLGAGSGSLSNIDGKIISDGHTEVRTGTLDNTKGAISSDAGLAATVSGELNNTGGRLLSKTDVKLTSGSLKNDGGLISADSSATIDSGSLTNRNGRIEAGNLSATIEATLDNSSGKLKANQLALRAANLTNQGGAITQYDASPTSMVVSGTLDNSDGGEIQTNSADLTLAPAQLNNASGKIAHRGTGTLTLRTGSGASALNNASGMIISKGQAEITAVSLDNSSGTISAQRGLTGNIAGEVNNTEGMVRSDASLALTSGGVLTNRGGRIQAGQPAVDDASVLQIQSASIENIDGSISNQGKGRTSVQGGSRIVNSREGDETGMGLITGNGEVTIGASSIMNTNGGQLSGADLRIQGTTLENSGGVIGNVLHSSGDVSSDAGGDAASEVGGDVTISMSGAVSNAGGHLSAARDLTVTAATLLGGGAYSAMRDANLKLQGDFTATQEMGLNVGRDLAITLPGTFTNRTNLQAVHNVSVAAGRVVNAGEMSAGALLSTRSDSLTNSGEMVGASIAIAAQDKVSNVGPGALIGGSDENGLVEILAREIENRDGTTSTDTMAQTAIYGLGKVVLAGSKNADGTYTNAVQVDNVSALLQSGGDMSLHADKVTNTRRAMKSSGYAGSVDPALLERLGISMSGRTGELNVKDPQSIGGVYTEPPHGGQWNSTYQYTTYTGVAQANTVTEISPAGQIVSGGKIDAKSVGTMHNHWSNVAAVGEIEMPVDYDADGWAASGQQAPGVSVAYSGQYHYNNYDNTEHDWQMPFGDAPLVGSRPGGYTQRAPADIRTYALPGYESTLASNGTVSGTGVAIRNTAANAAIPSLGLLPGQWVPGLTLDPLNGRASETQSASGTLSEAVTGSGALAVGTGAQTATLSATTVGSGALSATATSQRVAPLDPVLASATAQNVLSNLTIPQGGLFKPAPAPDARYVIETNPAFTRHKRFISSDYFFKQIGVDLTYLPKRLGDGFYEQQLVRNQITSLTGKAVLGPYADSQSMYESLLAAGAVQSKALDLPLGASLSADQVSKLTGNVILMETRIVDGQSVLVPVVYLAKVDQQNLSRNGPLITATDLDIRDARSFTNSGTVKAENALSIHSQRIDNAFGALESGGLSTLTAKDDVDLTSAKVKAGTLQLTAGGDLILDTATRASNQIGSDGATRVSRALGPTGELEVAGNASIATGGSMRQRAGNLTVGGHLHAEIGGDWLLDAQQVGEHKVVQRANGVSDTDVNRAVGSTMKVEGRSLIGVGGDFTARGAQIELGEGGAITANGNVTLDTASATSRVQSSSAGSDSHGSYAETLHASDQTLAGTTLKAGNTVTIVSGKDIALSGSTISLDRGRANLLAAGDVNVGAATETHEVNAHETHSRSGVLSNAEVASGIDERATYSVGSTISADAVTIKSGRDILVTGSNVVGTDDVSFAAARDVKIATSQDTVQSSTYYDKKEKGLFSNGGLSVSVGSRSMSDKARSSSKTNTGSMIGSLTGDVTMRAGSEVHATGSVLYAENDIDLSGKRIKIDSAYDTAELSEEHRFRQSGVTVSLTNPVVAAVQTGQQMVSAGQRASGDPRLAALAAATTALAAKNTADTFKTLGDDPVKGATSVGVSVTVGANRNESQLQAQSSTAVGSTVSAGRNVTITATGAGQDSQLDVIGSTISAGKDAMLAADGKVNLQAAENTSSQHGTNSGAGAGLGVSIGGGSRSGIALTASVSGNRGHVDGESTSWNETQVSAGDTLTIRSGGDTNLKGAAASGRQVVADIGGDLNIESLQDTEHYDSKQQGANLGVSVCVPPLCTGKSSVSASASQMKTRSDYASVREQSGIWAADGGFQVEAKGNTDLKGAVIASSEQAVQHNVNSLRTGTLTHSDIENHASYDASQVALSGGVSFGGGGSTEDKNNSGIGKDQKGRADNVNPVPGTRLPEERGISVGPPLALSASDEASSTTRSAVSGGAIMITDEAKQQTLTGQSAQDVIASLNRGTSDTDGSLAPIFDKEKVEAGFEITGQFVNQVSTFVQNRVSEIDTLKKTANDPNAKDASGNALTQSQRQQMLQQASEIEQTWGAGKPARQLVTALTAAAGGNVTGGVGQFVQSAGVTYLQTLGAEQVKVLAPYLGGEGSPAHAALHAVLGCAGGAGSGSGCGSGALGASAGVVLNTALDQLSRTEGLSASEKEARANLVSTIVAGVATVMDTNATGAVTAASVETRFNRQLHPEEKTLAKQLAEKSGGKYAQEQIEEQMRIMGVSDNGQKESGAPDTLVGQAPTDPGARWISGGTTADGKPILTQVTAQADPQLQSYILANANSAAPGTVPSVLQYDRPSNNRWGFNVTGPFTQFNKSDADFMRNTTADAASMVSTNAGRFGAAAATGAAIPSPYAPGLASAAYGATVVGWLADAIGQAARPDPGTYATGGVIDLTLGGVSNKFPLAGPFINELGNWMKGTDAASDAASKLNRAVGAKNENNK